MHGGCSVSVLADEKVKLGVLNLEIKQLVERVRPLLSFTKSQVA
jgi:predicted regulator of Ras-like GTPase activity (Roadblock/LC7/MglB family)